MSLRGLILSAVNDTFAERPLRRLYELLSQSAGAKYDRQTYDFLCRILTPESNCIDVGCYRGEILKWIIERAPRGIHHAFEPVPWNCAYLRKRFDVGSVRLHEMAVSDVPGSATFSYVKDRPARSRLAKLDSGPHTVELTVKVTTLDETIQRQAIAFVKIDVEGNELNVLKGAKKLLSTCRPYVLVEFDRDLAADPLGAATEMWAFAAEVNYGLTTLGRYLMMNDDCLMKESEFKSAYCDREDFYFLLCPLSDSSIRN